MLDISIGNRRIYVYFSHTILFFGCIPSKAIIRKIDKFLASATAWFDYNSNKIMSNDILNVTFDCDKRQIKLYDERTNKTHTNF